MHLNYYVFNYRFGQFSSILIKLIVQKYPVFRIFFQYLCNLQKYFHLKVAIVAKINTFAAVLKKEISQQEHFCKAREKKRRGQRVPYFISSSLK